MECGFTYGVVLSEVDDHDDNDDEGPETRLRGKVLDLFSFIVIVVGVVGGVVVVIIVVIAGVVDVGVVWL